MQKLDCLFIGSSTKDIMMLVDSPPASDQRISASQFLVTSGGVSSTAGTAFRRLGGDAGIISAVGEDDTSQFIREDLEKENFTYLKLYEIPNSFSSTSLVQVERNGKRCLTCFGGCIEKLTFSMLDPEVLKNARYIHLGVLDPEATLQICRFCKEQTDAVLSIDGGNMPLELVGEILPYTDIFIPDHKTAMKTLGMTPEDACRYYVEHGAGLACVTEADRGTHAYDGSDFYREPALQVPIVDTTGAGDNFHGAFLYCRNRGWDLKTTLRFSNAFATLSCTALGGRSATPSLQQVQSVLSEF